MQLRILSLSLASALLVLSSCQRTTYSTFQKSTTPAIERVPSAPASAPQHALTTPAAATPVEQTPAPIVVTPAVAQASAVSAPVEGTERTVTWATAAPTAPAKVARATRPTAPSNLLTKLVGKRLGKLQKKQGTQAQGKDSAGDTMALLSLIFGGAALLFLLTGIGAGTLLFGIAGLVLGLVALKRTSKRTMAVLGIVFGGLVVLLGLLAILSVGFS